MSPADESDERLTRWRLLLGEPADKGLGVELGEEEAEMDSTLAALYEQPPRRPDGPGAGDRTAGLGASAPQVARWLGDIRTYFPTSVVQVMQRDAIERLNLTSLLLEPELLGTVQPDVHLVATLVGLNSVMPETTRETARAVVAEPPVLLMDESLSALDLKLREDLQEEIRRLHHQLGTTVVFVTHDQGEALTLSDRIALMNRGRICQFDTPTALYDRPVSRFVADFIGRTNIVPVDAAGHAVALGISLDAATVRAISLRPEKLRRALHPGDLSFDAVVEDVAFHGATVESRLRSPTGFVLRMSETRSGPLPPPSPGETTRVGFAAGDAVPLFD